jgi:ABC-type branched-subunit amino acid transport system ATPase component
MSAGDLLFEGSPKAAARDRSVIDAYLGGGPT